MEDVVDKHIEEANATAGSVVAQRLWSKDSSLQFSLEMAADY